MDDTTLVWTGVTAHTRMVPPLRWMPSTACAFNSTGFAFLL